MSAVVTNEVVEFHRFLGDELDKGSGWKTPEQVLAIWRRQRPIPPELAESVAALREAVDAMYAGDEGRPAADVIAEMRRKVAMVARS